MLPMRPPLRRHNAAGYALYGPADGTPVTLDADELDTARRVAARVVEHLDTHAATASELAARTGTPIADLAARWAHYAELHPEARELVDDTISILTRGGTP